MGRGGKAAGPVGPPSTPHGQNQCGQLRSAPAFLRLPRAPPISPETLELVSLSIWLGVVIPLACDLASRHGAIGRRPSLHRQEGGPSACLLNEGFPRNGNEESDVRGPWLAGRVLGACVEPRVQGALGSPRLA